MIRFFLIITLCWATTATAQTNEDDRDWITGLIEDSISNDDLVVRLDNFQGALSSEATADAITLADADGIWLRLEDISIIWNRSALLSGAVEIENLSAERIELVRLPKAPEDEVDLPSAQATPFTLPDLPVSVDIASVSATQIILTEDLLGEAIAARFQGSLSLADGEADTDFILERTDTKEGRFDVTAGYVDDTRQLTLSLLAQEGEDGIAARMLSIPGSPSVRLAINGDAPLDDFQADIALATGGIDRITGTARLSRPSGTLDQAFALDLAGDLRPLLIDQYHPFFGANTLLEVEGTQFGVGGLRLSTLRIDAEQVTLDGSARLDAEGWPTLIDIRGELGTSDGTRVILPVSGPEIQLGSVSLNVTLDAEAGDAWTGAFDITQFSRDGVDIDVLALSGGGTIKPGEGDIRGGFSADMTYAARGLDLGDDALNQAIGSDIEGTIVVSRTEDSPTRISDLTLNGAGLSAQAFAVIAGPENRFSSTFDLGLTAEDFSRFAALSGLDLSGSGQVITTGSLQPFDGIFDITLDANTQNLALGIAQLDPLLTGQTDLRLAADRDTTGTRVRNLQLRANALDLNGSAAVTGNTAMADLTGTLADLALIDPNLNGAAQFTADIETDPLGVVSGDVTLTAPDTGLDATFTASPQNEGYLVQGDSTVTASDLSTYQSLIGQPVAGAVTLDLSGRYDTGTMAALADIDASTRDLALGIAQLDALLRGQTTLRLTADQDSTGMRLQNLQVRGDALILDGSASLIGDRASADVTGTLTDLGLILDDLSGAASFDAKVETIAEGVILGDVALRAPSAEANATFSAMPENGGYLVQGETTVSAADLAPFRSLIGQPVSGGVTVDVTGQYDTNSGAATAEVDARTRDIALNNPTVDSLLRGLGRINVNLSLSDAARLRLDALDVAFPNITATGEVASSGSDTTANLSIRLRDIALLVSDFSGPLTADINAQQDAAGWQVSGAADGPAGTNAQTSGRVGNDGNLSLNLTGSAPLALANVYIDPRRIDGLASFDLAIDGPPALTSVRGPITISNARLSAPTLQQSFENLAGRITLAAGSARIELGANSTAGGDLAIVGPVSLSPPFRADITATLGDIVLRDPTLYRTTIRGAVNVAGPLAGGAAITGTLDLGQTDVQVPSTGVSALGTLPDVTHLGPRLDVRRTLDRAGIGVSPEPSRPTSGPAYPIDLTVRAPSRIFVRGRGLDAELGGQLRLSGTTNAIIPIGRFDLVRGRLDILGQRFELDEGFAQLQGDFSPFLRLVATTETQGGTNVSIIVEGPADAIDVRFESAPELPQDEVLAQLLFGRDLSSISPLQAVQLASAVATLAGSGGGGVLNNIREGLNLDDFDLTTDEDGNAAVRAGKYISENVYTDVTIGSDGNTEINLNLEIDNNFTARGTVASDGETSVGVFFERDY